MNALALAVAAGCCWGLGELRTRVVLHPGRSGPLTALAVRSAVALPLLLAAAWAATRSAGGEPMSWRRTAGLLLVLLGVVLLAGGGGDRPR